MLLTLLINNQTPKWVILFKLLDNDSIFFMNGEYHTYN